MAPPPRWAGARDTSPRGEGRARGAQRARGIAKTEPKSLEPEPPFLSIVPSNQAPFSLEQVGNGTIGEGGVLQVVGEWGPQGNLVMSAFFYPTWSASLHLPVSLWVS